MTTSLMDIEQPRGRKISVGVKLLLPVFAIILILIGVQTKLSIDNARAELEGDEREVLTTLYQSYQDEVTASSGAARALSISFADRADIRDLFMAQDRDGLVNLLTPVFTSLKEDHDIVHLYIENPDGTVFVRIHNPDNFGDDVTYRRTAAAALESQETVSGVEVGPSRLGIRSVTPLVENGEFVGMVEVGLDYDQHFIEDLKARNDADYTMWVMHEAAAPAGLEPTADVPDSPSSQFFYYAGTNKTALLIDEDAYSRVLQSGESETLFVVSDDGEETAVLITPLLAYGDRPIGILQIATLRTESLSDIRAAQQETLRIFAVLALLGVFLMSVIVSVIVLRPLSNLTIVATQWREGNLDARVANLPHDEFGQLGNVYNTVSEELETTLKTQEQFIRERTGDLALAAEIGRSLSQIQDIDQLLNRAVNLIHDRYALYYTQIYLTTVDSDGSRLVLRAGTGSIGRTLLEREHWLPVSRNSINGLVAELRQTVIVEDTAVSDIFHPHPNLPDTRSELTIPLIIGDKVLGTLDMQSASPNTFTEDSLPAFEIMGSQLAISINNAILFTEHRQIEESLRQSETLFGRVLNNATAVIYVKQADGKYVLANKLYGELFGIDHEEVKGKTDHDFFPTANADALRQRDIDILGQLETVVTEEEIAHPDGMRTYISTKFPLLNEQGEAYAIAGILTDITKIKEAEVALAHRVAELDFLNTIGRKIEQNTSVPEFLEWVATQIPLAMSNADHCTASIQWRSHLYGDAGARHKLRHIIEEMRVQSHRVGYITVAYDDPNFMFEDADSALIGGIGQRIGAYLQAQLLLEQMQSQNDDLRTVAEIGTAVSSILDPATLLERTVERIGEKFDLYQVSIFLVDDLNQQLILSAGAGQLRREMTTSPDVIKSSSSQSMIARVARERRSILVNDVKTDLNYMNHPLLPDTAAELAIPMQIGEQLLGVLDVQSVTINAFSEEKAIIYTALATQVAVALQNAQQHERTQIALNEVNALQKAVAQEGWRRLDKQDGYLATANGVQVLTENGRLQIDDGEHIIMPMRVRGAQIGNIAVRTSAGSLSEADQELLNAVSVQVADALERTRFFEEIEQARHHTETLYNIGRVLPTVQTSSELLRVIADGAAESINANQILLLLCDVDKEIVVNVVTGGVGRENVGMDINFDDIWNGLSGWTLRERKTAFSPKFVRDERESIEAHTYRLNNDVGSLIVVPLIYQNKILGTLTATNLLDQPDFTPAEAELLTAFGIQATVAIENRNLLNETQKRARREQTLREITTRVNTAVDAESVLQTAVKEVGRAMGLEIFAYLDDSVSIDTKDVG